MIKRGILPIVAAFALAALYHALAVEPMRNKLQTLETMSGKKLVAVGATDFVGVTPGTNGQALIADSATASGVNWSTVGSRPGGCTDFDYCSPFYWDFSIGTTTTYVRGGTLATVGTVAGGTYATTSFYASRKKLHATRAVTGANLDWGFNLNCHTAGDCFYLGNASGRGGGYVYWQWGHDGPVIANLKCYSALCGSCANLTAAEPSAGTSFVGVAFDTGENSWRVYSNDGAGAATEHLDLGTTNFSSSTMATNWFRILIEWPSNASSFDITIWNLTDGVSQTATVSSDLPANTTFLRPEMRCGNGSSAPGGTAILAMGPAYGEMP